MLDVVNTIMYNTEMGLTDNLHGVFYVSMRSELSLHIHVAK